MQNECSRGVPLGLALVVHLVQSQEMDVDLGKEEKSPDSLKSSHIIKSQDGQGCLKLVLRR